MAFNWICSECAKKYGGDRKKSFALCSMVATFHQGECDICRKLSKVTEFRDYGLTVREVADKIKKEEIDELVKAKENEQQQTEEQQKGCCKETTNSKSNERGVEMSSQKLVGKMHAKGFTKPSKKKASVGEVKHGLRRVK